MFIELSLFPTAVLDFTQTTQGRALLRQWCLHPSLSIPIITSRHDAVSCFLRSENLVPADQMRTHLKGFRGIGRTLGLLRQGKAGIKDWDKLLHVSIIKHRLKSSYLIPSSLFIIRLC